MGVIVRVVYLCTDVQSRHRKEQYDVLFHIFRNDSSTLYLYVEYTIEICVINEKTALHGVLAPQIFGEQSTFFLFY